MQEVSIIFDFVADNAVAIICTFVALVFSGHVAYEGSRRSRKAEAAAAFRDAFKEVILNLRENPDLPSAQIANLDRHAILAAAQQYRLWVYWLRRGAFDRAVARYKQACEVAGESGSVFAQFASENTEFAQAKRKILNDAVHRLYVFGKPT